MGPGRRNDNHTWKQHVGICNRPSIHGEIVWICLDCGEIRDSDNPQEKKQLFAKNSWPPTNPKQHHGMIF